MPPASRASIAARSPSNTRAGPSKTSSSKPADFTTAPSGASEPCRIVMPPVRWIGSDRARSTLPSTSGGATSARFSARVLPVTVRQSPCSRPASSRARMMTGPPPTRSMSVMTKRPKGFTSARCGTREPTRRKSSRVRSTSASWAMAMRCRTAFVEPPNAMTTAMAFSNASLVMICRAVMPLRRSSTTAWPDLRANPSRRRSALGGEALPGSDMALAAVGQARGPRHDRPGVEEDAGEVEARGGHEHAGQALVAPREQHRPVEAFGHHDGLDAVGDDLAADEGEVHALVAHGDAVADRDRAELHGEAAAGVHPLLARLREAVEREVAGGDFVPGAGDADLGLLPVVVGHADRAEHAAGGGALEPVGDVAAARLDVGPRLEGLRRAGVLVRAGAGGHRESLGLAPCRAGGALSGWTVDGHRGGAGARTRDDRRGRRVTRVGLAVDGAGGPVQGIPPGRPHRIRAAGAQLQG